MDEYINEIVRFFLLAQNIDTSIEYNNIYLLKNVPFRNCKNIKNIMNSLKEKYNLIFTDYASMLCIVIQKFYPNINSTWIVQWLKDYNINENNIDIHWLFGNTKIFSLEQIPLIVETLKKELKENNDPNVRKILMGFYGEYLVFNKLREFNPNAYIEWVSRTVGDGLGYDIYYYDPISNIRCYIEVKSRLGIGGPFLSEHETKVARKIMKKNDGQQYHIFVVPMSIKDNEIDFDIIDIYKNINHYEYYSFSNKDYIIGNPADDQNSKLEILLLPGNLKL